MAKVFATKEVICCDWYIIKIVYLIDMDEVKIVYLIDMDEVVFQSQFS